VFEYVVAGVVVEDVVREEDGKEDRVKAAC
jgi:hypothetical protein